MTQVCVVYNETRPGRAALEMAISLSKQLNLTPLLVFVARNEAAATALGAEVAADKRLIESISFVTEQNLGCQNYKVVLFDEYVGPSITEGSILVDAGLKGRVSFHCLHPGTETTVVGRHKGPVLIPFSDGDTGLKAANAAFEFVERSRDSQSPQEGVPDVIFYHTTWPNPNALSSDTLDHMCESAERCMLALQQSASDRGISFQTIVETHDDVVQGVIEMAYKTGSVLIAMARGSEIRQGSYVDRLVEQSPIPVLVTAEKTPPVSAFASTNKLAAFYEMRKLQRSESAAAGKCGLLKRLIKAPIFTSPMFVMSLSATMYLFKVISKCLAGNWMHLTTMLADGVHNVADLLQSFVVMTVIKVARRPENERYNYGRKNLEWQATIAIGVVLAGAAAFFLVECVSGMLAWLVSWWPAVDLAVREYVWLPVVEPSTLTLRTFLVVAAIMGSSVVLSLSMSRIQISVGKRTGHASMIADGQETRGDALIEAVVLLGIFLDFTTGWRVVEYPFGVFVAWQICCTAKELVQTGYRVLNQHTIGEDHVKALEAAAMGICGVISVKEMKTDQVGHAARVVATVETMARSAALGYVRKAVEDAFRGYLLNPSSDFKGAYVHVTIQRPDPKRKRIGYALRLTDTIAHVALNLASADHLAVCDVEHGEVVRTRVVPLSDDPAGTFLEKRVQKVYVLQPDQSVNSQLADEVIRRLAKSPASDKVPVPVLSQARSYTLSPLGLII